MEQGMAYPLPAGGLVLWHRYPGRHSDSGTINACFAWDHANTWDDKRRVILATKAGGTVNDMNYHHGWSLPEWAWCAHND